MVGSGTRHRVAQAARCMLGAGRDVAPGEQFPYPVVGGKHLLVPVKFNSDIVVQEIT